MGSYRELRDECLFIAQFHHHFKFIKHGTRTVTHAHKSVQSYKKNVKTRKIIAKCFVLSVDYAIFAL